MVIYSAANDVLHQLTRASRLERFYHSVDPEARRKAEQIYAEAYTWLTEHGVPFTYDTAQRCYVVEAEDAD